MQFSLLVITLLSTFIEIYAAPFPITQASSLNCRSTPSTSGKIVKTYPASADIKVSCTATGDKVEGSTIWDKTQDNCFVADFYVKTGSSSAVAPPCSGASKPKPAPAPAPSGKVPGPRKDDYKFKSGCGGVDPFNYFKCQCTSFVAQRINERLGIKFNNHFKGPNWGNANTWDEAAKKTGFVVDSNPKPGAIAQSNKGSAGHVAWVSEVTKDGKVVVEEYNFNNKEAYGVRTVPKSTFNYIHLK